jgi:hypothetical protein
MVSHEPSSLFCPHSLWHTFSCGLFDRTIDAYLKGFNVVRRDAYPAVKMVTLESTA